jgi:hypothetical protein
VSKPVYPYKAFSGCVISSQIAWRAKANLRWPKFFQPARFASDLNSRREKARAAERRAGPGHRFAEDHGGEKIASNGRLPEHCGAVTGKLGVVAHYLKAAALRLSDEHPVERIAMKQWEVRE